MELIDTHCHIDVDDFGSDREAVWARARLGGVSALVVPGVEAAGWDNLLTLCRGERGWFPALGLHPVYLERHSQADIDRLRQYAEREPLAAIGEVGLDYFIENADRNGQQALFEAQLGVARDIGLPVLLHVRKAHDQVLATLRRFPGVTGIAHAFGGSLQQARQYIDLGFKLGFGGVLTFDRAKKIRRLAAELPLEAIVLETDAPDLPPVSHRNERNSPEYLPDVLRVLSELRETDPAALARATFENARAALPRLVA